MQTYFNIKSSEYLSSNNVICLTGIFFQENITPIITVKINDYVLGEAYYGRRISFPEKPQIQNAGWVFEKSISPEIFFDESKIMIEVIDSKTSKLIHTSAVENLKSVWQKNPSQKKIKRLTLSQSIKKHFKFNNIILKKIKQCYINRELFNIESRENTILVCVHNLHIKERAEKLHCFEAIDTELRKFGWKLLIAHNSNTAITKTSLEVIELKDLRIPWYFRSLAELKNDFFKTSFFESIELHKGFFESMQHIVSFHEAKNFVAEEYNKILYITLKHKPYQLLLWHQWNSFAHMNILISKLFSLNHAFIHEGIVPNTLGIDFKGEMAESTVCKEPIFFNELEIDEQDQENTRKYIKHVLDQSQDRKPQVKPGAIKEFIEREKSNFEAVIFYGGVNDWQTGMIPSWWPTSKTHSPTFYNSYDALFYILNICEKNNWLLIFKPHPNVPISNLTPVKSKNLAIFRQANILECLQEADVIATPFSSIAYNALMREKPVVMLGHMQLSISGACYQPSTIHDVEKCLKDAIRQTEIDQKKLLFKKHLAQMLKGYLFPYTDIGSKLMNKTHADTARFLLKNLSIGNWNNKDEMFNYKK